MQTLSVTFLILLTSLNALAQTAPDRLYPGYPATTLNSYQDVEKLFDEMPLGFRIPTLWNLKHGSECFHRAQIWTYDFYKNRQINAMKAFVFYTHEFKRIYRKMKGKKFDWWFHVTPYVLSRNATTGAIEEWTIDATFAETPLAMKPWTDLFIETKKKCAEFVPYAKFKNEVENGPNAVFGTEHCYLVRVPATDFSPEDVEARSAGLKKNYEWDFSAIDEALRKAPKGKMESFWRNRLGM